MHVTDTARMTVYRQEIYRLSARLLKTDLSSASSPSRRMTKDVDINLESVSHELRKLALADALIFNKMVQG